MKLERIVKQKAVCININECFAGEPTKYPLEGILLKDENKLGDYCQNCTWFAWRDIEEIDIEEVEKK